MSKTNNEYIKEYKKFYRETHKEAIAAYKKAYRASHPSTLRDKERSKAYRESHKEVMAEYKKKYYADPVNRELKRQYDKQYRLEHRDEKNLKDKMYASKNKEKIHDNRVRYYYENRDKTLAKMREDYPSYYETHKERLLANNRKYHNTLKGKITYIKSSSKRRSLIKNTNDGKADEYIKNILTPNAVECYWCGNKINNLDAIADHLYPLKPRPGHLPGTHTIDNIVVSCHKCNNQKSNNQPYDFVNKQIKYGRKISNKFKNGFLISGGLE